MSADRRVVCPARVPDSILGGEHEPILADGYGNRPYIVLTGVKGDVHACKHCNLLYFKEKSRD